MKVTFGCPGCDTPGRMFVPGERVWQCPLCDHRIQVEERARSQPLVACAVCGNAELYKKKNFPHTLGLTILTIACVVSFITYLSYQQTLTWILLGGTALFDIALFFWVGDAVVCYRCGAVHSQLTPGPEHKPFDLGISERYRQERMRREQVQAENALRQR